MHTDEYTKHVNKTSRSNGAVGRDPVCYRQARKLLTEGISEWQPGGRIHRLPPGSRILDFGCGKGHPHTLRLRAEGHDCVGWDIGVNACASSAAIVGKKFHLVLLSNVLNVQPDAEDVRRVLREAWSFVAEPGFMLMNYPAKPRHNRCSDNKVYDLVREVTTDYIKLDKYTYLLLK